PATLATLSILNTDNACTLLTTPPTPTRPSFSSYNATALPAPPSSPTRRSSDLGFTQQPQTTQAGATMSTVQVAALDDAGNVVTGFSGSISVAIGANPSGGTLSGTKTHSAANGLATFTGLSIDKAGNGYTLVDRK